MLRPFGSELAELRAESLRADGTATTSVSGTAQTNGGAAVRRSARASASALFGVDSRDGRDNDWW